MSRAPVLTLALTATMAFVGAAEAQEMTLGQIDSTYPRMVDTSHIDPNTFVMGHPSSVHTHAGHANFEHPAVAHHAIPSAIDANTFIPRHPAGAGAAVGTDAVVADH